MTHLQILKDKEIIALNNQIDILKQDEPLHYGLIHVENVLEYAKQLAKCFELTKEQLDLLLMASALHNIGHLNGKTLHAQTGAEMAKAYLKKHQLPIKDINIICNAISSHLGRKSDDFYEPISACLMLADKMDFAGNRIKPNFYFLSEDEQICKQITKVSVNLVANELQLILSGRRVNWDAFVESDTYSKVYKSFEMVCKKHGFKFVVKVGKT